MNGDPTQFEEPILQLRRQIEEATAAEADPGTIAELEQKLGDRDRRTEPAGAEKEPVEAATGRFA